MIYNLQLARALAALAVVFYHTGFLLNKIHTQFQAVHIFFVISGIAKFNVNGNLQLN